MKKIFFFLFLVFLLVSCDSHIHYIYIHQKEIVLIYDDNKTMTDSEKLLNEEAGLITFSYGTELPHDGSFEVLIDGDKCINVKKLNYGNNIQITPIAAGECKLIVRPYDLSFGTDSCKIIVKNKSEL